MNQNLQIPNFVMASLLSSYPGPEFDSHLGILLEDKSIRISDKLRKQLTSLCGSEERLNDLRSTYIEIFDHAKSLNPLYETEYGRERAMFKANELSDIGAFYTAFGFELDSEGQKEMLDHISVELEFYSLLKMKLLYLKENCDTEGIKIVSDGMTKFLQDHLGRFSSSILTRPGVQANGFYSEIFKWINDLVEEECKALGIQPEKVAWLALQPGEDSISCGGAASFNK